jgi:hypothetical protein
MNRIIVLISLCFFSLTTLLSQIDPFSDFKKSIATERKFNYYFFSAPDSVEIITNFDATCNPLKTIKSQWTYRDKKLFYQDKDSFSYVMVGNILRPASKTYSIWHFDKQGYEDQTRYTFNYQNNNPYFVERISSVFDTLRQRWFKRTAESFLLDKNGNTLVYENYDPYSISKSLFHKVAYEYTDWGALKYFKREHLSNGEWRTDTIKVIAYDQYHNKTVSNLTTYTYDKYGNQLNEMMQKDSTAYSYNNGLLISKRIINKSSNVDSFFYNVQKNLTLKKTFYGDILGRADTTVVYCTDYIHLYGRDLPQKQTFKRKIGQYNSSTQKDTSYWITSYEQFFTYNKNNQLATSEFNAFGSYDDYLIIYSKVFYGYCGEINTPSKEIYENLAFTISPNPTNQILLINANENKNLNGMIQIVDVLGNIIRSEKINNLREIEVSNLPNGIYFLKIQVDKSIGVKKFIVQH